jgi:hypothetical protein
VQYGCARRAVITYYNSILVLSVLNKEYVKIQANEEKQAFDTGMNSHNVCLLKNLSQNKIIIGEPFHLFVCLYFPAGTFHERVMSEFLYLNS